MTCHGLKEHPNNNNNRTIANTNTSHPWKISSAGSIQTSHHCCHWAFEWSGSLAPTPAPTTGGSVFHPSLSVASKTLSAFVLFPVTDTGIKQLDPTKHGHAWSVPWNTGGCADKLVSFDLNKAQEACRTLQGTRNFSSFQGAPREHQTRRNERRKQGFVQ